MITNIAGLRSPTQPAALDKTLSDIFLTVFLGAMFLVTLSGILGSYAFSMSICVGLATAAIPEHKIFGVLIYLYPGMPYAIGYSILGFFFGVKFWKVFSKEGPLYMAFESFREHTIASAVFTAIWLLCWGLLLKVML